MTRSGRYVIEHVSNSHLIAVDDTKVSLRSAPQHGKDQVCTLLHTSGFNANTIVCMSGDLLCVPSRGILYPFSLQQSIPSVAFEVIFGGNRSDHMIFECVSLEFWSKGLSHSIGSRTYPPYEAFAFLSLLRGFLYLDCPDLVIELHHVVGHGFIAAINSCPVGGAGWVEAGW